MTLPSIVQIQKRASNGRFLSLKNEMKVATKPGLEGAFLVPFAAAAWKLYGFEVACLFLGTWLAARLLSSYEVEAQPGFGLLGNSLMAAMRTAKHFMGMRPIQALLDENDERLPGHLETVRTQAESMIAAMPKEDVHRVEEITVRVRDGSELVVRLTFPKVVGDATEDKKEPLPLAFYCHGGAFVAMSPRAMDAFQRQAANAMGCVVAAPYYRQAPEHKFPTAHEDCADAFAAIVALFHKANASSSLPSPSSSASTTVDIAGICDLSKIALWGDSAGGHLACHLAFCASRPANNSKRGASPPPELRLPSGARVRALLLFSPVVIPYSPTASHVRLMTGPLIGDGLITWMWNAYLGPPPRRFTAAASPMANLMLDEAVDFSAGGMPPTIVQTGQFDPLCDEGELLANRLAQKGVRVYAARRLEGHCLYHPSTVTWAFDAAKALLQRGGDSDGDFDVVPDVPM